MVTLLLITVRLPLLPALPVARSISAHRAECFALSWFGRAYRVVPPRRFRTLVASEKSCLVLQRLVPLVCFRYRLSQIWQ